MGGWFEDCPIRAFADLSGLQCGAAIAESWRVLRAKPSARPFEQ